MKHFDAVRLATIKTHSGKVSYWEVGEEVYRLNEYEPVQFDIYGVPLGARWETNRFNWDQFKRVVLGELVCGCLAECAGHSDSAA